jgi:hypothetical protein
MIFSHATGLSPTAASLSTALGNAVALTAEPLQVMAAKSGEIKSGPTVQGVLTLTGKD